VQFVAYRIGNRLGLLFVAPRRLSLSMHKLKSWKFLPNPPPLWASIVLTLMKPKQLSQGPAKLMECTQNSHRVSSLWAIWAALGIRIRDLLVLAFWPVAVIQFAAIKDYNLLKFLHRIFRLTLSSRPGDYYNPIFNFKCAREKKPEEFMRKYYAQSRCAVRQQCVFSATSPIPSNAKLFTQTRKIAAVFFIVITLYSFSFPLFFSCWLRNCFQYFGPK